MIPTINKIQIYNTPTKINKNNLINFGDKQETNNIISPKKENKIPAILLTAASLGLGIWGYFKIKKSHKIHTEFYETNIEKYQIYLKNIFNKSFNKEETKQIIERYKELNKINKNNEFYNKMFEQLKKDFKVENKNLKLEQWDKPHPVNGGEMHGYTEALTREIGAAVHDNRTKTLSIIFHEFKHVKQNELMYRADSARLIKAKVKELENSNNASWKSILQNHGGNKEKARKAVQKEVEQIYQKNWGHLTPLTKTSQEYKQGIKYLDNEENRIPPGPDYYEQILEKEAQFVENNAKKLFEELY